MRCGLSAFGLGYLLTNGQLVAAGLGAFALASYVFIYTPLKTRTPLNTLIGAIPGAVPPLMGWAAAHGRLDRGAIALFLIVVLWQIPHFLAIAWIFRDQYASAGLRMFPLFDPSGVREQLRGDLFASAEVAARVERINPNRRDPFQNGTTGGPVCFRPSRAPTFGCLSRASFGC